ncbi:MAG: glycosyltransferase family 39 protein [Dysgonamonadaceae bacterium]|jgi:4-amino-4-deoxy-L-arabinose transferase-like glycosyltransferase|nr:glycosyltransferase family 39 protein [Dysgonamonadaceae bacterium]
MRTRTLQYLYLQRPLVILILITALSTLVWVGKGEFYTKGEPREASVALSMINDGNWVLPSVYAGEIAYKPPFTHWMTAVFSLPNGKVTPFTSRLPSAFGFIGFIVVSFLLFGRKLKFQEAFVACMILLCSFELHRAAMTARVDMLLTFFIVLSLLCMYKWEVRRQLRGFPLIIPLILSASVLTKGPVGLILPLLVFGVYLVLLDYSVWEVVYKLALIAVSALLIPAVWYLSAYREGGREFLNIFLAENFGRFLSHNDPAISYHLGHEEPCWYNFLTLLWGFIPWTLLYFFSLFSIRFTKKWPGLKTIWQNLLSMEKIKLFSLVAAVIIIFFYCIPSGKRSVYLMPAYPFIAIFLSQFTLYLAEYRSTVSRIFCLIIGLLGTLVAVVCLFPIVAHGIDPVQWAESLTHNAKLLSTIDLISDSLKKSTALHIVLLCCLITALSTLFYQLGKKNNLKLLYATIGVYLCVNLVADGIFLPAYKNKASIKPFAEQVKSEYAHDKRAFYVMNNLKEYSNMYGLNFYLNNSFRNFEQEMPSEGLFFTGKESFKKVESRYGNLFQFQLEREINNPNRDGERIIQLYSFTRK